MDPRPLKDKIWQTDLISNLTHFLPLFSSEITIDLSSIKQMSKNSFEQILKILLKP